MLIDMDAVVRGVVTAGDVVPRQILCYRVASIPKPNVEGVEENAVRIIWIDRDALIVPVLVVIRIHPFAVSQRCAIGTGNLCPSHAAIRGAIRSEFTTLSAATGLGRDRLQLCVNVIRIARRDRDVDSTNLIADSSAGVGSSAGRIQTRPAV